MTRSSSPGPRVVVRGRAAGPGFLVQEVEYAPGYRQPPHAHPAAGITLILAGGLRESALGREEEATALSVVVKPAGVIHADEVGPRGARTVLVEIHDPGLLPYDLGPWRWLHAGPGLRPLLSLPGVLRDPGGGTPVADTISELIDEVSAADTTAFRDPPAWLLRAREALDDGDPTAARVRDLADAVGVHPVSLTRAFRRCYGLSVVAYRSRVRLRRAASLVTETGAELTRIAYRAGYADHSHMCRQVRDATGRTPSEIRALARPR